jgi:hypothetical protein
MKQSYFDPQFKNSHYRTKTIMLRPVNKSKNKKSTQSLPESGLSATTVSFLYENSCKQILPIK